ncbi:MAG: KOW domain-containing RNA-binding protein [Clostridia bacterium]
MKQKIDYSIGEIVTSISGRDVNTNYIVIKNVDDDFVYVANGKTKFLEKPKLKRKKHLKSKNQILEVIKEKLVSNKKVYDEEIFSAFRKNNIDFFEKEIECQKKM